MRHIDKKDVPDSFKDFVKRKKPKKWEDIHQYDFTDGMKECRKHILEDEQMGLGGYTELPLSYDREDIHIDHFRKRSLFNSARDIFDWNNFIVDVHLKDKSYGADYKDDNIKDRDCYNNIINPIEEDPHHYFQYMENGDIAPQTGLSKVEKDKAVYTIDTFNLNHQHLRKRRSDIIELINFYSNENFSCDIIKDALISQGFMSVIEYYTEAY